MRAQIDFPLSEGRRLQAQFDVPMRVLRANRLSEVSRVLAAAERAASLGYWVVGFVSYEAAPAFDEALCVKPTDAFSPPLALFAIYEQAGESKPAQQATSKEVANAAHAEVALPDFFCKSLKAKAPLRTRRIRSFCRSLRRSSQTQLP